MSDITSTALGDTGSRFTNLGSLYRLYRDGEQVDTFRTFAAMVAAAKGER